MFFLQFLFLFVKLVKRIKMSTGFIEDQYSSDEWNQKYADLEKCFKETFYCIDKAIKLDEEGNTTNVRT